MGSPCSNDHTSLQELRAKTWRFPLHSGLTKTIAVLKGFLYNDNLSSIHMVEYVGAAPFKLYVTAEHSQALHLAILSSSIEFEWSGRLPLHSNAQLCSSDSWTPTDQKVMVYPSDMTSLSIMGRNYFNSN